jgi:hypothetical protein
VDQVLDLVFATIGPLPGRYQPDISETAFRNLGTTLKDVLKAEGLPNKISGNHRACLDSSQLCRDLFVTGVRFVQKVNTIYPRLFFSKQFSKDRPGKP